jgi:hypothetical protein
MIMQMNALAKYLHVCKMLVGQYPSFTDESQASVKRVICVIPLDSSNDNFPGSFIKTLPNTMLHNLAVAKWHFLWQE